MREEIRILSEAVDRHERIAAVGASGSGKTSTIRELLLGRRGIPQRILMFDPYRELPGVEVFSKAEALRLWEGPYGRVRVCSREALWAELLEIALKAGDTLVIADEAQRLLPKGDRKTEASGVFLRLVTEGRHARCPLIWATQSPGRCSLSLTDNSTGARVVGNLSSPSSLERVADWGIPRKEVTSLRAHELLLSQPFQPVRRFFSRKM